MPSMTEILVPTINRVLKNLSAILDKGAPSPKRNRSREPC
jgi:hypothetical protein